MKFYLRGCVKLPYLTPWLCPCFPPMSLIERETFKNKFSFENVFLYINLKQSWVTLSKAGTAL